MKIADIFLRLSQRGWSVQPHQTPTPLPNEILLRYRWIDSELAAFSCAVDQAVSEDEKAWIITSSDFSGKSDSAFVWNEWEQMSLSVVADDLSRQQAIVSFWNRHFPILYSVKSLYSYIAVREDGKVVAGNEPEFEETTVIADSLATFLEMLEAEDVSLHDYI